ncbi:hypothetical protein ACJRO7_021633 [Eucalyptus globulus]|uniref:Uncharacterized protein n=1 Tax=Eucalyptus globulus TaxID=34317 RepID=A0ABD3KKS7_EUCGL
MQNDKRARWCGEEAHGLLQVVFGTVAAGGPAAGRTEAWLFVVPGVAVTLEVPATASQQLWRCDSERGDGQDSVTGVAACGRRSWLRDVGGGRAKARDYSSADVRNSPEGGSPRQQALVAGMVQRQGLGTLAMGVAGTSGGAASGVQARNSRRR